MVKRTTRRDLKKESRWRELVHRQSVSGMSIRGWCRDQGVQEATFQWWRRELARRDVERKSSGQCIAETQAASFVPVRVTDDATGTKDHSATDHNVSGSPIEIMLTDGRRVRITGTVNRQTLTDVLDVLTSVSPSAVGSGSNCSVEPECRAC